MSDVHSTFFQVVHVLLYISCSVISWQLCQPVSVSCEVKSVLAVRTLVSVACQYSSWDFRNRFLLDSRSNFSSALCSLFLSESHIFEMIEQEYRLLLVDWLHINSIIITRMVNQTFVCINQTFLTAPTLQTCFAESRNIDMLGSRVELDIHLLPH